MLDDAIRSAVAVARYGSFTVAAEHECITQSAITKRVAELEQRLGYAIFSRTARGVILTDEGLAFVDRAARLLEDLELLMLKNRDPYTGPLRVGVRSLSLLSMQPPRPCQPKASSVISVGGILRKRNPSLKIVRHQPRRRRAPCSCCACPSLTMSVARH